MKMNSKQIENIAKTIAEMSADILHDCEVIKREDLQRAIDIIEEEARVRLCMEPEAEDGSE